MIAEKLLDDLREQKAEADRRYRELAVQVAAGETVDNTEALAVLTAAGRSPDELDREVRRLARIAEIEPQLVGSEALLTEWHRFQNENSAKLETLKAARDEAEEAIAMNVRDYETKYWEFTQKTGAINELRQELSRLQTPPQPMSQNRE